MKKIMFFVAAIMAISFASCCDKAAESQVSASNSVSVENVDSVAVDSVAVDSVAAMK